MQSRLRHTAHPSIISNHKEDLTMKYEQPKIVIILCDEIDIITESFTEFESNGFNDGEDLGFN